MITDGVKCELHGVTSGNDASAYILDKGSTRRGACPNGFSGNQLKARDQEKAVVVVVRSNSIKTRVKLGASNYSL